ncbi:hypothetical protein L1887_63080 [Cichorium endivia]|nr:hypothetical protein L1887_63080 [Cichorium endivia]
MEGYPRCDPAFGGARGWLERGALRVRSGRVRSAAKWRRSAEIDASKNRCETGSAGRLSICTLPLHCLGTPHLCQRVPSSAACQERLRASEAARRTCVMALSRMHLAPALPFSTVPCNGYSRAPTKCWPACPG